MAELIVQIAPDGNTKSLYSDKLDMRTLGHMTVERASQIEWDEARQTWFVQFPDGAVLRDFKTRDEALACEILTLQSKM